MMNFTGKVAMITGSGSGLGRAAAILFAKQGAKVVVSDVNIEGGLQTVQTIVEAGGEATFIACDVANEDQVNSLIAKTIDTYGRLDAAVNNAGIGGAWIPSHKYNLENFEKVMAINSTGVFLCMKAELEVMLKQGSGAIVNISSVSGLVGFPNNIAYAASKHAVVGMTRTAGLEYGKKNIRVNAVCPVFTVTPMVTGMLEVIGEDLSQKLEKSIPMKRFGQPEEIADAIVWLCSENASFMNGHALPVDGGMTAG
jgi:NAD(P)-dependent dehydrogenase (short-subunit alcohol dehydrogenase family)